MPQAILPLLMIGGAYLCFEGVEKLLHKFLHKKDEHHSAEEEQISEKDKIKGAVRTDFILSAEIIIIALGVLQESSTMIKFFPFQVLGSGSLFLYTVWLD
ncbi:inner membrane protein [Actinobacillus equuli]|nr:inner membrane protein [Actinobacillus equuli]